MIYPERGRCNLVDRYPKNLIGRINLYYLEEFVKILRKLE